MKTLSVATAALAATAVTSSPIEVATPVELAERATTTHYLFSLYVFIGGGGEHNWKYHASLLTFVAAATPTLRQASMSLLGRCRIARTRWVCPFVPRYPTRIKVSCPPEKTYSRVLPSLSHWTN